MRDLHGFQFMMNETQGSPFSSDPETRDSLSRSVPSVFHASLKSADAAKLQICDLFDQMILFFFPAIWINTSGAIHPSSGWRRRLRLPQCDKAFFLCGIYWLVVKFVTVFCDRRSVQILFHLFNRVAIHGLVVVLYHFGQLVLR